MTTATSQRRPELTGQIVVVTCGGAGIGLDAARGARTGGAPMLLAGRNPGRLERAAAGLPARSRHVMVTAAGPAAR